MDTIGINPAHFAMLTILLNGVGKALKEIPGIPNGIIPLALSACGGVTHGFLAGFNAESVIAGVVAGMSAVGLHQTVTHAIPKPKDPDKQ